MLTRKELLKQHPLVVEAEEMRPGGKFKDKLSEFMPPERVEAIMANVEQLVAHRIVYISSGHKVVGFVVEPKEEKKRPVIIYARGGSNDFGKILPSDVFVKVGRFALWGFMAIATQYSGSDGGEGKDEMGGADLEDILVLKQIIDGYPYADAAHIGMFGTGRGGLMTYMTLAKADWLKAAATIGGISDIAAQEAMRPEMKDFYRIMLGESDEARAIRSAVNWPDKLCKKTPLLLLHGANDTRVPPESSAELAKKLDEQGIAHKLVIYEGAEHALVEARKEADDEMHAWFDRYLMEG